MTQKALEAVEAAMHGEKPPVYVTITYEGSFSCPVDQLIFVSQYTGEVKRGTLELFNGCYGKDSDDDEWVLWMPEHQIARLGPQYCGDYQDSGEVDPAEDQIPGALMLTKLPMPSLAKKAVEVRQEQQE